MRKKTKKKTARSTTKKKKPTRTTTAKKPVKKTKTKKVKAQKPKKRITHKLTYAPRKIIKTMVHSGNGTQQEYLFKPDKIPDRTPAKIKDVGQPNLRTQLVQLKCKKLRDLPAICSPNTAADILNHISKSDREIVQVLYLNHQNKVIGIETAHKGTVNSSPVSPHEIFKTALLTNATGIIIAHNHPSGNPTPSEEDIQMTKSMAIGGKYLNIELMDSIVIGRGKYYSLKQEGNM